MSTSDYHVSDPKVIDFLCEDPPTRHRDSFFCLKFQPVTSVRWLNCWIFGSNWRRATQGELSSSPKNASLWETKPSACDEKLPLWNNNRKSCRLCLKEIVWIFFRCYCSYVLNKNASKRIQFIRIFFKNNSILCEMEIVLVSLSVFLLVAANFCIYQVHTESKK